MADIKISELPETTDLEGLYTIGTDKNNLSKKVSFNFLKDAANYANMQGDYAKEVGDSYGGKLTELKSIRINSQYFSDGKLVTWKGRACFNGFLNIMSQTKILVSKNGTPLTTIVRYYDSSYNHLGTSFSDSAKYATITFIVNDGKELTESDINNVQLTLNGVKYDCYAEHLITSYENFALIESAIILNSQYFSDGKLVTWKGRACIKGFFNISSAFAVSAILNEISLTTIVRYYDSSYNHLGTSFSDSAKYATITFIVNDGIELSRESVKGLSLFINGVSYDCIESQLLPCPSELVKPKLLSAPKELFSVNAYYSHSDNRKVLGGSYMSTHLLPIELLKDFVIDYLHPSGASANKVTLFDSNMVAIAGLFTSNIQAITQQYPTAVYISLSIFKNNMGTLKVTTATLSMNAPSVQSAKIFERVACIGDSYTAGYILLKQPPLANNTHPSYSWVAHMKNLTGRRWDNYGLGGSTAKQWVNGGARLAEVKKSENKAQAYVIGLMLNDSNEGNPNYTPIGSASDIGIIAETYYSYYYRLIQEIVYVNTDAKIFCFTCPQSTERLIPYNQAVRDIVAYCKARGQNVYLIDAAEEYNTPLLYGHSIFTDDYLEGHYSPIGYEYMAECLMIAMSDVINRNLKDFQNVFQIDFVA